MAGTLGARVTLGLLLAAAALPACMRSPAHDRSRATAAGSSSPAPLVTAPSSGSRRGTETAPSATVPTPAHYVEVTVGAVGPTPHGHVVLLLDPSKRRAVPIFIGESEAFSIKLRLKHQRYPRPLSHDLLESVLHRLGGEVQQVSVDRVEDNAYVATVVVVRDRQRFELDARSSDAIALALGNSAPIFMAEDVLRSAAVDLDRLPPISPPEQEDGSLPPEKGVAM